MVSVFEVSTVHVFVTLEPRSTPEAFLMEAPTSVMVSDCPTGSMLLGTKCTSFATDSYRTVPGRFGPLVIASVMEPLVAVEASNASSKMTIKSEVAAPIVVAFVGKVPITVGAEASALAPVVNLVVYVAGSGMLLALRTEVLTSKLYVVFAASAPGVIVSTFFPVDVLKLNPESVTAVPTEFASVMVEFAMSVDGFMSVENSTAIEARLVGILVLPLNGAVPTTVGGTMLVKVCPAAPVVEVAE